MKNIKKVLRKRNILYDNNELNGENFNDILNDEIRNNFIKIIAIEEKKVPRE